MKKLLMMLLAAFTLSSFGQGRWERSSGIDGVIHNMGDSLYVYTVDGMGQIVIGNSADTGFSLLIGDGCFQCYEDRNFGVNYTVCNVKVELYDKDWLKTKDFRMMLDADRSMTVVHTRHDAKRVPVKKQGTHVRQIFKTLKSGGKVCFIIRRPGMEQFDLKVEGFAF